MEVIRTKRATDPLDERVRDRLRGVTTGYASSGSEHDGNAADVSQSFFSDLLHDFLEPANAGEEFDQDDVEDSDDFTAMARAAEQAKKLRQLLDPPLNADSFRFRLRLGVEDAITSTERGISFRRTLMARLRERGFNAGICKARWENAGGLAAGRYEYVDVVDAGERYIVDLGFAGEFEVARATEEYAAVAAALPEIAVALPEEVRAAVKIMAEAARRSLKSRGLCVPPWRKRKHMIAKWLGPYLRTVNLIPAIAGGGGGGEIKCREVGFGVTRP